MSFSRESRNRNFVAPSPYAGGERRVKPGYILIAVAVLLILLCCCCLFAIVLLGPVGGLSKLQSLGGPTVTPTVNVNAPVPLNTKALAANGLELTVTEFQLPLQVKGTVELPSDQEFALVSIHLRNTKRTGTPIKVSADDFKVKGDGGLTYDANPSTVTIPQQLTESDLAAGAGLDGELIFQVASNDSGLKLYWTVGESTRVFQLQKP
ncbi:MAG: DUF4352 domain-containing protein [Chloroflexi bacterium]|nr:DUF4352 domain-containing protein [Chloroflexota bacterium]